MIMMLVGEIARLQMENLLPGRGGQPIASSVKRTWTYAIDIAQVASITSPDPQSAGNAATLQVKALAPGRALLTATDDLGRIGAEVLEVVPVIAGTGVRDQRPCFRVSKIESAQGI